MERPTKCTLETYKILEGESPHSTLIGERTKPELLWITRETLDPITKPALPRQLDAIIGVTARNIWLVNNPPTKNTFSAHTVQLSPNTKDYASDYHTSLCPRKEQLKLKYSYPQIEGEMKALLSNLLREKEFSQIIIGFTDSKNVLLLYPCICSTETTSGTQKSKPSLPIKEQPNDQPLDLSTKTLLPQDAIQSVIGLDNSNQIWVLSSTPSTTKQTRPKQDTLLRPGNKNKLLQPNMGEAMQAAAKNLEKREGTLQMTLGIDNAKSIWLLYPPINREQPKKMVPFHHTIIRKETSHKGLDLKAKSTDKVQIEEDNLKKKRINNEASRRYREKKKITAKKLELEERALQARQQALKKHKNNLQKEIERYYSYFKRNHF